ncbi:DNA circularization N-terminal domain-containing protein [Bradyrhizobium sp. C-145]|uniref:DNA circularization N-terminal domain-containing protein n=1 Tax=Bradyrhizobium sp. C-145 TaxID=574727 RepID=UPI00201B7257|nr:DNA circularization N-terminal domain-containing protein [Bradyrhizobium sp. C-145]UQR66219.1 DNA circularization N-terminal domain-containing protein [Bradyrhizobium sp. C-145]
MTAIRDIHNPWRDRYQTATFRGAMFHVETDHRQGGRRTVVHEYPKRNLPYAEDMGRSAIRFTVQGYLIGPDYLYRKDALITALEQDGPGTLRLPLPYQGQDMEVMVVQYSITESRERGGMCGVEMDFVEYGKPGFSDVSIVTQAAVTNAAAALERMVLGT